MNLGGHATLWKDGESVGGCPTRRAPRNGRLVAYAQHLDRLNECLESLPIYLGIRNRQTRNREHERSHLLGECPRILRRKRYLELSVELRL